MAPAHRETNWQSTNQGHYVPLILILSMSMYNDNIFHIMLPTTRFDPGLAPIMNSLSNCDNGQGHKTALAFQNTKTSSDLGEELSGHIPPQLKGLASSSPLSHTILPAGFLTRHSGRSTHTLQRPATEHWENPHMTEEAEVRQKQY